MFFEYSVNALNALTLTSQLLVLALPVPLGRAACTALEFLVIHDGLHRVFGGLGMAIFRLVVKAHMMSGGLHEEEGSFKLISCTTHESLILGS